jgi:iron complex transport system substrate-binding protein
MLKLCPVLIIFVFLTCQGGQKTGGIISLAPSITESIYLLGAQDKLIGVTTFCKYPPEAQTKQKIGTMLLPNLEKIIQLSPHLILATFEGNPQEQIARLKDAGLNVFVFGKCKNFLDISNNFLTLAKLVGKSQKAYDIIKKLRSRIATVKNKTKNTHPVKVFCQIGIRPLVTAAGDTFIDQMIYLAGGINIAHEKNVRYPLYNVEEVIKQNPDVIIIAKGHADRKDIIKFWQEFKTINAVKNNRIYLIDARKICCPTPLAFVEGLEELASLLHPRDFKK